MLKGSRRAIVRGVQAVSFHGQIALDVRFVDIDDPDGPVQAARVGAESAPRVLSEGDCVEIDYVLGVVTAVRRTPG